MKPLLFILLSLICFSSYGQTAYYFSNSGNDNNAGTVTSPLKTIDKLNKLLLKPGDNVRFHCGDSFPGQLNIKASGNQASPIIFDSYGVGNKAIINGAVEVKNWTKLTGKNIWQASLNTRFPITDLYINSKNAKLSRYPKSNSANKGFLTIASHSGGTQLTSRESIQGNWVGAELVYMPNQWLIERCKIIGQNGNTFTITKPDTREIADGWGFFIQNHIGALGVDREWSYDSLKNTISLYYANGNPNDQKIEITYFSKGVAIANCSNITLRNLEIDKTANNAISGYNVSNIVLNNLKIDHSGEDGIKMQGKLDNILIENNYINHSNNDAVTIDGASNFKFINNTIKNTGINPGRGKSNAGQYSGLEYTSDAGNAVIQDNKLDSVGYNGINFSGSNILVKNNTVSNFCLIKSDGGGIYTWDGDQKNRTNEIITGNILLGCTTYSVPVSNIRPHVDGIYLDDCSRGLTVSNNTIANCINSGIYLHGANNVIVTGNSCYNNGEQFSFNITDKCDVVNNTIQNNIFFSRIKNQPTAILGKNRNQANDYGKFSNNIYISPNPTQSLLVGYNEETKDTKRTSLNDWKTKSSKDANSVGIGGADIYSHTINFVYNDSNQTKTIQLNGSFKDVKNNVFNGQITLQPFTSAILLKVN